MCASPPSVVASPAVAVSATAAPGEPVEVIAGTPPELSVHSDEEAVENPDLEPVRPKRVSARLRALRAKAKSARHLSRH